MILFSLGSYHEPLDQPLPPGQVITPILILSHHRYWSSQALVRMRKWLPQPDRRWSSGSLVGGAQRIIIIVEIQAFAVRYSSLARMATGEKPSRERQDNTTSPTDSGSSRSSYPIRRRRNPAVLIRWIEEHPYNPYPTKAEKHYLAFYAGMTQRQLNDWFANARRNIKKVGYEAWKKKHSGFSAILSGIPLHNTGTGTNTITCMYVCTNRLRY